MKKYRGFENEVPTMGNLGQRAGYEYVYPELYVSSGYRGTIQQRRITGYVAPQVTAAPAPTAQISPLQRPPVIMVPPSPPAGWYPPTVTLPPPVPGTDPVPDYMLPDMFTDDYQPLSPISIAPIPGRGTGPAGIPESAGIVIADESTDESVAFPYVTNGDKETVLKKTPELGGAALFAALVAFALLGG